MRGLGMELATPQTLADIQDQQAERERARRVKEANLAAYDAARREERSRSGGSVSAMSDVGPGGPSFSNTTIGPDGSVQREGFGDPFDMQSRVGSEFADLARRSAMAQRHNARLGTDSLSAAMRAAMANGGRLPQNLVGLLSRNLGMDGNNQSVFSAGFLNNGDFDIDIVTRGANGGLLRTTRKITPQEQYGIVNATPGVWGNDGIAMSRRLYNGLRNTMGKSELPPMSVYTDNLAKYNEQQKAQSNQKDALAAMNMLMDYEKQNKAPMSEEQFLRTIPKSLIELTFPPRYEEGSDPSDPERPTKPYTPQEIAERTKELMASLRNGATGNAGNQSDPVREALIAGLRKLSGLDAPQTPPDVAAFQQGQRERQMRKTEEAQAREDVTERPQQLINYYKDGKWYSGNGYIIGGEVYDGNGYPIEGATPAEMVRGDGGRLVGDGKGGFATRALPSARELVSGGAGGGEAQGGGSQGGGANWTPGHDLRNDGKTYKGTGWLGVLRLPNGGVASEYTVGVEINGKEVDIPTLVPTLSKAEQDLMVNDIIPNNKDVPEAIMKKAVEFAKMRIANGQSVFANDGAPQQAQQPAQGTQGAQQQPAQAQEAQAEARSNDLLDPDNADAFIADVNKGISPERSRAIEVETAAKAEKARRQKRSAEPIDDREWAETMKSANESTGGVVQRDRGAESRTAARDFFSSVFDDIVREATIAADRAVAFDEKHVGPGKGVTREEAYRSAFTHLVNKRLGEMSEADRRRLERVDPGNLKSPKINLRQSLYDRYGVDVYDGGRGFVGAITGVGNLDNRGGFYEDLVDSDGNTKKGTWRRGGDAYNEYGRSVSLWR